MDQSMVFSHELNNKYIETNYIKKLTNRALAYLNAGYAIHLSGVSGVGKSALAFNIAKKLERPFVYMCGNEDLSNNDLVGGEFGVKRKVLVDNYIKSVFSKEEEIKKIWVDGRLIEACKNGYTLIYDEFTRAKPEANNILLSVLEEKIIEMPNLNSAEPYLKVHPNFKAIFTSNPQEYAGVYKSPSALLDRMITIHMSNVDINDQEAILVAQSGINKQNAHKIIQISRFIRNSNKDGSWASLRSSIMLANVVKTLGLSMDPKNVEFRDMCKDIYNSSSSISGLNAADRIKYNKLIDEAINTVFGEIEE